ncbi:sigma-70 family RNA polymerase sigma factor [Paraclostridium bifermentans]|uniref:sigma-70 family RNA polymerase sigma factor n=1 Tax=Paraclostridium bifermentans TaxID=1490 RepID=UPI00359C6C45
MVNLAYDYYQYSDEELVILSKEGDPLSFEILFDRYKEYIYFKSQHYFIKGAEREDLVQEGIIGLFKAIRDYDIDKNSEFKLFCRMCIKRQLITAVTNSNRNKHKIHIGSVSLEENIGQDSNINLKNILPYSNSCEEIIIYKEEKILLKNAIIECLSELEKNSLTMYYQGFSYSEIATKFGKNKKSIDASINRAKNKLRKQLKVENFKSMLHTKLNYY